MKLRAISLGNVRQFAGELLQISDLTNGLNVISQPNEFGKSTIFDALQALFFQPYGANTKELRSLQPQPAQGAVQIIAEVETEAGLFRIDKRYLVRARAVVTDLTKGQIVAQDGAAEIWIDRLLGHALKGPTGLLWVRQGGGDFAWDDRADKDSGLPARRDILSAVAGEIDQMTGGRRFDQVMRRADEALGLLQTATGKPRGDWKAAQDRADALRAERQALAAQVADLGTALGQRRRAEARMTVILAPEAAAARLRAEVSAQEADQRAREHVERLARARSEADLALAYLREAAQPLEILKKTVQQARKADETLSSAKLAEQRADDDRLRLARQTEAMEARVKAARATLDALHRQDRAARAEAAATTARDLAQGLRVRLTQAETARRTQEAAAAIAAADPATPERLATVETVAAARERALHEVSAASVTLRVDYAGQARVLLAGQALSPGATLLEGPAVLEVPGLVRIEIDPGQNSGSTARAALVRADAALAKALTAVGQADLAAARRAAAQRVDVLAGVTTQTQVLRALAPAGLEALRGELARVSAQTDANLVAASVAPVPPQALAKAEASLQAALDDQSPVRTDYESALRAQAAATTTANLAQQALTAAQEALGDPATVAERQGRLQEALAKADAANVRSQAIADALDAQAPDLATVKAELGRATSARNEADKETATLRQDLAGLNEKIAARAEDRVEERLAEVEGTQETLGLRLAAIELEAAALARLRQALSETRAAARDAYFGPVEAELRPLLAILHGGAALQFDAGRLLPDVLTRDGVSERLTTLSGGTQEQIAILTRLAFARLLARQGRPVPVILDDALVHSDDERIVQMFTALHRVAAEQQILVLTCRQMAFAALGGHRPRITKTTLD